MTRRRNPSPEERARLREKELERSLKAGRPDSDKADAAMDALVRKSIKDHGA